MFYAMLHVQYFMLFKFTLLQCFHNPIFLLQDNGFRGRRTDSVGGNCAGKHAHKAKSWSGAGEECWSGRSMDGSGYE